MKIDRVEYYAGGWGEEKPLAVYKGDERILVKKVILAERILDSLTGGKKEVFDCLLINGERVKIEKLIGTPP